MGTGTTTFLWYFLCCGFVLFVSLIASGLVFWGNRKRKRSRGRLDPPAGDG